MVQEQKDWLSSLWVSSSFVQLRGKEQSSKGASTQASQSHSLLKPKAAYGAAFHGTFCLQGVWQADSGQQALGQS